MTRFHASRLLSLTTLSFGSLAVAGFFAGCSSSSDTGDGGASSGGGGGSAGGTGDGGAPDGGGGTGGGGAGSGGELDGAADSAGGGDSQPPPPPPPPGACQTQADCPKVTCVCAASSDPCGTEESSSTIQICKNGTCATSTVCPTFCGAGRVVSQPSLPSSVPFGTGWTPIPTPAPFDVAFGAAGAADDSFSVILDSNYPQLSAIRSKVVTYAGGAFTDQTPSRFVTFPPGVAHEAAFTGSDGSSYHLGTTGTRTPSFSQFGAVYGLDGKAVATAITAKASTVTALLEIGGLLVVGGQATNGTPLLGEAGTTSTGVITLPPAEATVLAPILALTATTGGAYAAATRTGILSVQARTATDVPLPSVYTAASGGAAKVQGIAFANGALYAELTATSGSHATLWKLTGTQWSPVCSPDKGVSAVSTLRDGTLFAATNAASYLYDGAAWMKLPTAVDSVYGSKATLFGFINALPAAGKVLKLQK